MTLQPSPTVGFGDLMDMVTDFGIESLRVGSYEARKALVGCDDWKLSMLRDKRQEARERIAKALYAALASQAQPEQPKQDSVHLTSDAVVCAATAQPVPDLHTVIRQALANHRLTHQHEDPDSGLLLVDALSCGEPTITKGREELDLLADAVWFDVCAALTDDQPDEVICQSCNGTGDAYIPRDGRMAARCDACKGRGVVYDQP